MSEVISLCALFAGGLIFALILWLPFAYILSPDLLFLFNPVEFIPSGSKRFYVWPFEDNYICDNTANSGKKHGKNNASPWKRLGFIIRFWTKINRVFNKPGFYPNLLHKGHLKKNLHCLRKFLFQKLTSIFLFIIRAPSKETEMDAPSIVSMTNSKTGSPYFDSVPKINSIDPSNGSSADQNTDQCAFQKRNKRKFKKNENEIDCNSKQKNLCKVNDSCPNGALERRDDIVKSQCKRAVPVALWLWSRSAPFVSYKAILKEFCVSVFIDIVRLVVLCWGILNIVDSREVNQAASPFLVFLYASIVVICAHLIGIVGGFLLKRIVNIIAAKCPVWNIYYSDGPKKTPVFGIKHIYSDSGYYLVPNKWFRVSGRLITVVLPLFLSALVHAWVLFKMYFLHVAVFFLPVAVILSVPIILLFLSKETLWSNNDACDQLSAGKSETYWLCNLLPRWSVNWRIKFL